MDSNFLSCLHVMLHKYLLKVRCEHSECSEQQRARFFFVFVFCFFTSMEIISSTYDCIQSFYQFRVPVLVSVRPALISHTVRMESLSTLDTIFHESIRSLNTVGVLETSS